MLVITANWAYTDGSLWHVPAGRHDRWLTAVHRAALRSGFGRDGIYRPIDAIDIVFAGDTFDCLASRCWTETVRPWHGGPTCRAGRTAVMVAAARRARRLFATLGRWTRIGLPTPAADRRGRPLPGLSRRAEVRVTLLAGDRDRWIDEASAVASRHGHAVGRLWATTDLVVHHGAELDPLWTSGVAADLPPPGTERPPLLGESLAVDLVACFAATILDRFPAGPAIRTLLTAVGTSLALDLPAVFDHWLAAADGGRSLATAARDGIHATWRRSVGAWHREAIRRPPACGLEACPVDALASWLELGTAAPPRVAAAVATLRPRFGLTARRTAHRLPGFPAAATVTTVLGHAASPRPAAGADSERVVCLGGAAGRTLIRGRDAAPAWEPLEGFARDAGVIGRGAASSDRSGADTVVDAVIAAVGSAA